MLVESPRFVTITVVTALLTKTFSVIAACEMVTFVTVFKIANALFATFTFSPKTSVVTALLLFTARKKSSSTWFAPPSRMITFANCKFDTKLLIVGIEMPACKLNVCTLVLYKTVETIFVVFSPIIKVLTEALSKIFDTFLSHV